MPRKIQVLLLLAGLLFASFARSDEYPERMRRLRHDMARVWKEAQVTRGQRLAFPPGTSDADKKTLNELAGRLPAGACMLELNRNGPDATLGYIIAQERPVSASDWMRGEISSKNGVVSHSMFGYHAWHDERGMYQARMKIEDKGPEKDPRRFLYRVTHFFGEGRRLVRAKGYLPPILTIDFQMQEPAPLFLVDSKRSKVTAVRMVEYLPEKPDDRVGGRARIAFWNTSCSHPFEPKEGFDVPRSPNGSVPSGTFVDYFEVRYGWRDTEWDKGNDVEPFIDKEDPPDPELRKPVRLIRPWAMGEDDLRYPNGDHIYANVPWLLGEIPYLTHPPYVYGGWDGKTLVPGTFRWEDYDKKN